MFCHKYLWFFQDHGRILGEYTHPYATLIRTDYEDVYYHTKCFFRVYGQDQIFGSEKQKMIMYEAGEAGYLE